VFIRVHSYTQQTKQSFCCVCVCCECVSLYTCSFVFIHTQQTNKTEFLKLVVEKLKANSSLRDHKKRSPLWYAYMQEDRGMCLCV